MKLYRVLLLIVFSCAIFFASAISDILAQQIIVEDKEVIYDGPYTAYASAKRYGGALTNGLHVFLYASAASTPFGRNSRYGLVLATVAQGITQWEDKKSGGPIDGQFFIDNQIERRAEPNIGVAAASVSGDDKSVTQPINPPMYRAVAGAGVPAMVFLQFPTETEEPGNGTGGGCSSNTPGMYSLSGLYTATPGDTHEVCLITDAPYSQVYWYVKVPWDTSPGTLGTPQGKDTGDGTTKEATFSYTFPSGAMHTGTFRITAYIYRSDNTIYEESYTVTVEMVDN